MAVLYITEFQYMGQAPNSVPQMPQQSPVAEQTVAIGGSSAASAAFNSKTRFVRLHTDAICAVEFGTSPTAVVSAPPAGSARMAANQTEYHGVPEGGSYKVAVISTS